MKWIISEVFYPDEVSTALIMTEIAEELASNECVNVICGPEGYEKTYKPQLKPLNPNISIYRVKILNHDKNSLVSRVIRLLALTFKMTFAIIRKVRKGDDVLIVTNPAFLLLTLACLKSFKGIKLKILVHDVFPENLVPAGLAKKDSFKFKILNRVFNWAYGKADKLIVLGEDMGDLMREKLAISEQKVQVIPNWSDPSILPIEDYSASKYFGIDLSEKIVIGFAGNIGRLQGLPEFIEAFIASGNEKLALILVGDGALKAQIEKDLIRQNVKNVHFVGSKPRAEQTLFLNACDLGLITLKQGMSGLGVPSKTYNLMAAKKPVLYIGDHNSEVDRYIRKFENGWSYNWEDTSPLINFLSALSESDKSLIRSKGEASLKAVNLHFQKEQVLKLYNNF